MDDIDDTGVLLFDGKLANLAVFAHGFVNPAISAAADKADNFIAVVDALLAGIALGRHVLRVGGVWSRRNQVSKYGVCVWTSKKI